MKKPQNYDTTQVGFETLTPGGHKCIIKQVQETKSSTGKDMLVISFDTHPEDTQPNFFMNRYLADKQAGKDPLKWRGTMWLVTDENTDYGTKNLKTFNTAVCDSNPGFELVWGDKYAPSFKDKLVGIIFRLEDYYAEDYSTRTAVKPMRCCDFNKAFEQKVPDRKVPAPETPAWAPQQYEQREQQYEQQSWNQQPPAAQAQRAAQEGFMQIPPDALQDEGLPFH